MSRRMKSDETKRECARTRTRTRTMPLHDACCRELQLPASTLVACPTRVPLTPTLAWRGAESNGPSVPLVDRPCRSLGGAARRRHCSCSSTIIHPLVQFAISLFTLSSSHSLTINEHCKTHPPTPSNNDPLREHTAPSISFVHLQQLPVHLAIRQATTRVSPDT